MSGGWKYLDAPQAELKWYPDRCPRITRPLPFDFDGVCEATVAVVDKIHRCGRIDTWELLEPHSGDSWELWPNHYNAGIYRPDWKLKPPRAPEMLQAKWEREERERQLARQQEADRLWNEEVRRQAAIAAAERERREAEAERKQAAEEQQRKAAGAWAEKQRAALAAGQGENAARYKSHYDQQLALARMLWPGEPVQSPLTGEWFATPESYIAHLLGHNQRLVDPGPAYRKRA